MLDDVERDVLQWAEARNILEGSTKQAQTVKLGEEFGELCAGISKGNMPLAMDSVGDMMVVLAILAHQLDTDLLACFEGAYEEIKHRTGKMIDGVFVKESDIQ
jgi:NTP pyrophosphatase (non-canonical NTP hydrolase)